VLGVKVIDMLNKGHNDVIVGYSNGKIESYPLEQVMED
jgi:hypothetical protein